MLPGNEASASAWPGDEASAWADASVAWERG